MQEPITPDEVYENVALLEELSVWISERKERAGPSKMAFLLILVGVQIMMKHRTPETKEDEFIEEAVKLGKWMSKQ